MTLTGPVVVCQLVTGPGYLYVRSLACRRFRNDGIAFKAAALQNQIARLSDEIQFGCRQQPRAGFLSPNHDAYRPRSSPDYRRTELGMGRTFQITNVFTELSLAENLVLSIVGTDRRKWIIHRPLSAFPASREQALAGLEAVGLVDRCDQPVKLLSYGERRQLELALALNTSPKVLFLDEPCAGLAPGERVRIFNMVRALPRDITVILIEHDMDVALG